MRYSHSLAYVFLCFFLIAFSACHGHKDKKIKAKQLIADPASIDDAVKKNIADQLTFATDNEGKIGDSVRLQLLEGVKRFYEQNDYTPFWSSREKWKAHTAPLVSYLQNAALDGLFRDDYHFDEIVSLKNGLDADSVKRTDAVLWTKADLLLTDAFMHVLHDLKVGRLQPDSIRWKDDPAQDSIFVSHIQRLATEPLDSILKSVQPVIQGYWALKNCIPNFIDSMDTKKYTYITYPYKTGDKNDSLAFVTKLLLRFKEASIPLSEQPDSFQLAAAIKKYQQQAKLTTDGKISTSLIRRLNMTDLEKYNRIAMTLDKFKELPAKMPEKYVFVNLPGFYMQVWDSDTITFTSKIICGKPSTSTPFITSAINNMVIYPTWTVPSSIIKKEILPGLKKSSGYLARKGLNLLNEKGEHIDPSTINWAKYSKGIPYKVQQGSGDDNALGVIKFNFNNPFDVYLHDTNQRHLFKNTMRALSHGCVRVQDWEKLAFYIARNDSMLLKKGDSLRYNTDSITNWIVKKEKHRIDVKNRIPLFIRYLSCEGIDGRIKFYDDIYDEDKKLKEKFFAHSIVHLK